MNKFYWKVYKENGSFQHGFKLLGCNSYKNLENNIYWNKFDFIYVFVVPQISLRKFPPFAPNDWWGIMTPFEDVKNKLEKEQKYKFMGSLSIKQVRKDKLKKIERRKRFIKWLKG